MNYSHESQCQGRDKFSVFHNLFSVATTAQTALITASPVGIRPFFQHPYVLHGMA